MSASNEDNFDFVTSYAEYADVLESPKILHELAGIQLVATTLNRNRVSFHNGAVQHSLDFWSLMLSGSGGGRSTTVGLVTPILELAKMQDLERPVNWGSASGFYQDLAENRCGLFVWGEFSEHLKRFNDRKFGGVKEWLTDRYDNFKIPPPFTYRKTRKSSDTPAITFDKPVRTNIAATSSEDWFFRNLAETDSAGGLLPRFIIVRAGGAVRDVPTPRFCNQELICPLVERLVEIDRLEGEADISAILPIFEKWYGKAKRRFEAQPNQALATAFFNRHRVHVLKLAVIFEASRNASLTVTPRSWVAAFQFARKVEESIFKILHTGMNSVGYSQQLIENRIRRAGPEGLSRNDLTRSFQSLDSREREGQIKTLCDADRIQVDDRPTGGRRVTVYIHEDFRQRPK
jgi:hypothetical protein